MRSLLVDTTIRLGLGSRHVRSWAWVLAVATVLGAATPALACSCPSAASGTVSWPQDGATGVATDTPIVVALSYQDGNPGDIGIALTAADGADVPLREVQRLPPSWHGCGSAELVVLRPARKLEAGMTYAVSFSLPPHSKTQPGSSFSVGGEAFVPEEPVAAALDYLAVYTDRACTGPHCNALGSLRVELDRAHDTPLWLVVQSHAAKDDVNHWTFWPAGSREAESAQADSRIVQLSVALDPDDRCADVRIYGVEGRSLFEEQRCSPDRCAVTDSIGLSTCGAPPSPGVDPATVPTVGCETPDDADAGSARPESNVMAPAQGTQSTQPDAADTDLAGGSSATASAASGSGASASAPADAARCRSKGRRRALRVGSRSSSRA